MTTKLKEVDVLLVGLGWTGGILAKELTEAGHQVVALERGAMRSTENDFAVPRIRDDLATIRRSLRCRCAGSDRSCRAKASAARACTGTASRGAGPTTSSRCAASTTSAMARTTFPPT